MASLRTRAVYTNTCGRGAYRGPWMFETVAREQMVDPAARADRDRPARVAAPQRRGHRRASRTRPDRTPARHGQPRRRPSNRPSRSSATTRSAPSSSAPSREDGRLLGIGIGLYVEPSTGMMDPMGTETAVVRVNPNGRVDGRARHRRARSRHRDDDGPGRGGRARHRHRRRHDRPGRQCRDCVRAGYRRERDRGHRGQLVSQRVRDRADEGDRDRRAPHGSRARRPRDRRLRGSR